MSVKPRQLRVLAHTMSSMDLDCLIDDLQAHSWRIYLCHSNVALGCLESILVRLHGCKIAQQT